MGKGGRTDCLDFDLFHEQVGNEGANGGPMAALWTCSKYLPWKKKKQMFLRQTSSKVII